MYVCMYVCICTRACGMRSYATCPCPCERAYMYLSSLKRFLI